jgi:hypothetical protein
MVLNCLQAVTSPGFDRVIPTAEPTTGLRRRIAVGIDRVDLHTGPITRQLRDQVGLRSATDLRHHVHTTVVAVILSGPGKEETLRRLLSFPDEQVWQ